MLKQSISLSTKVMEVKEYIIIFLLVLAGILLATRVVNPAIDRATQRRLAA
jgi:hypothetical protein